MIKDTKGKARLELLKRHTLIGIAKVREFGINKYQNDVDWQHTPEHAYLGAALRHIYAAIDGEELDPESGLPHIDHAMASLMLHSEQKRLRGTDGE